MDGEQVYALAACVKRTPSYRNLDVHRAWSAMHARQVEAEDRRTGERLLLLSEDQFDNRLAAGRPMTAQPITAQPITAQPITAQPITAQPITAQTIKRAAVSSN